LVDVARTAAAPHDSRTTSSVDSVVATARAVPGSAIAAASRLTAPRPSSTIGTRIVVSVGRT